MTRYAPEFLAALRQRYEDTDQPMRPLALEFGIGISTLSSLVEREGWKKRSLRRRGAPDAPRIAEATALMATLPPRASAANREAAPSGEAAAPLPGERSAAERLEALLMQEIAAEEAARAELGDLPRLRAEADSCTRRLAILTQTLKTLRGIAPPAKDDDDPAPRDIDELRNELARRIRALVLEEYGPERVALDRQFADLSYEEKKELAAFGRERGMPSLLRPLEETMAEVIAEAQKR